MGSKLRMLFVDDRSKRLHAAMRQYADKFDVTIATNVQDVLRMMSSEAFDVISLDHDLNGCDFEDPDSPTCGMEVVRYIQKTGWPKNLYKPRIRIHSKNLFAAYLMATKLQEMGFHVTSAPFIYDDVSHIEYDEHGVPK